MRVRQAPAGARTVALLALAVIVGTLVRLLPVIVDPGIDLRADASYHERMVAITVTDGRPPAIDPLSESPVGRRLETHLPAGLYHVAAWFHRALAAVGLADLRFNLLLFTALAGALVALPVFQITRLVSGSMTAALLAAFIIALLPGHVHRTVCYWVRYEALGTTLGLAHVGLAMRAFSEPTRGRRLAALLSAALLVASAAVWRVPLIFPLLAGAFVAWRTMRRGAEPAVRDGFTILVVAASAGLAGLEYLRIQGFLVSGTWLALAGVAAATWLPAARPGSRPAWRVVTVLGMAGAAALLGMRLSPPSPYGAVAEVMVIKFQEVMGDRSLADAQTGVRALFLQVQELYGLTPAALLIGPQQFFLLGPWFVASPWLFAWSRGARLLRTRLEPAVEMLGLLCISLLPMTLAFMRNKILLGPFVAIVCGALAWQLWHAGRAASPTAAKRRKRRARPRALLPTLTSLALWASILATMVTGVILAESRHPRLYPQFVASMAWLRENTEPGAIVLSAADLGYDLQRYTGRGTISDGLLESPENQRRIIEVYGAFLQQSADSLRAVCGRYRVSHLLIPSGEWLRVFAEVAGEPFAAKLQRGQPLEPPELDRTIIRLMLHEDPPAGFEQVFRQGGFRIYAFTGS